MARKTAKYTVEADGRDKGKVFVLNELPASQGERWAIRAVLALINNGVDLPEGFDRMGMAAMAELGIRAISGLKWDIAEPLLDEMWQCVEIQPDPTKPLTRKLVEEDIEEISTRITLRMEVFKLHTDFLQAVALSSSEG